MLFKKSKPIKIGLDLGSAAIKIVKLEPNQNGRLLIQKFIIKNIPSPRQQEVITDLLKESLAALGAGVGDSGINISLSGRNVITRYVSMPVMKPEEFKNALKFEAQKYIPFSIDDVEFDGCILKQDLPGNKMLVLIAAAKREFVNQRIKLLQDLGHRLNCVYIDSLALSGAFDFNYSQDGSVQNKTIALVNIGASITNLSILEAGVPCLSRDIPIAGNEITEKIASDSGLDYKAAEELKINPDKDKFDKVRLSVEHVLSQISQELRVSFDYYESQSVSSVEEIFLSGGGSLAESLEEVMGHQIGIPLKRWDPLSKFELNEGLDAAEIKSKAAQLAVACGLAMV